MTSGLRRVSTPAAPMQKISAETTRYQPIATAYHPPCRSAARLSGGTAGRANPLHLGLEVRLGRLAAWRTPAASAIVPV